MVKNLDIQITRHLTHEEHIAIVEAALMLEKAFKRNMHTIQVRPNIENPADCFGVMFMFDLTLIAKKTY